METRSSQVFSEAMKKAEEWYAGHLYEGRALLPHAEEVTRTFTHHWPESTHEQRAAVLLVHAPEYAGPLTHVVEVLNTMLGEEGSNLLWGFHRALTLCASPLNIARLENHTVALAHYDLWTLRALASHTGITLPYQRNYYAVRDVLLTVAPYFTRPALRLR